MRKNLLHAFLVNKREVSIYFLANYTSPDEVEFFLLKDDEKLILHKEIIRDTRGLEIIAHSDVDIELGHNYRILSSEGEEVVLDYDEYVSTQEFEELYSYDGDDLGCNYSKDKCIFNLWSPLSEQVYLKLEKSDNSFLLYKMKRKEHGLFTIEVKGDLYDKKYSYIVKCNNRENEIRDPYGKAVSLRSQYSVVVDLKLLDKLGTVKVKDNFEKYTDAVIYELHVRDFTENLKTDNSGNYLGILDKVDYLKSLGVTHIQLLPVLDSAKVDDLIRDEYNWGYDPISWFALEGSYSSFPEDALSRMVEFKTLVNELHKNGIRVILDVVYNHIYDYITHDFQKNIPYFYFRKHKNKICNASGCGNDIASERKMVRKIIVDSVTFLMKTYDIDGFRFDLMGLMDVDTANEIASKLKAIKKDCMLIGEAWHMGVVLPDDKKASMNNAAQLPDYAFFNDTFRDLIKGPTFNHYQKGYISGNIDLKDDVEFVMKGSVLNNKFPSVQQSLNYVECHDNQTLYDKLANTCDDKEEILRRVKFANALTILSLGIPFIHMGQEIGLSKFGVDNSYNMKNINNMDWKLLEERIDMAKYVSDLIKVRKANKLLYELDGKDEIAKTLDYFRLPNGVLTIVCRDKKYTMGYKKVLMVVNPTDKAVSIDFDEFYTLYFGSGGLVKEEDSVTLQHYLAAPVNVAIFVIK